MTVLVKRAPGGAVLVEAYGADRQRLVDAHREAYGTNDSATKDVIAAFAHGDDPLKCCADPDELRPAVLALNDPMLLWELNGIEVEDRAERLREEAEDLEANHIAKRPRSS